MLGIYLLWIFTSIYLHSEIYKRYSIIWCARHSTHSLVHWENFHSEYGALLQLKKKNTYIIYYIHFSSENMVIEYQPLEFGFSGTVIFLQTIPLHTRYVYQMHFYMYFRVCMAYVRIKLKCWYQFALRELVVVKRNEF